MSTLTLSLVSALILIPMTTLILPSIASQWRPPLKKNSATHNVNLKTQLYEYHEFEACMNFACQQLRCFSLMKTPAQMEKHAPKQSNDSSWELCLGKAILARCGQWLSKYLAT